MSSYIMMGGIFFSIFVIGGLLYYVNKLKDEKSALVSSNVKLTSDMEHFNDKMNDLQQEVDNAKGMLATAAEQRDRDMTDTAVLKADNRGLINKLAERDEELEKAKDDVNFLNNENKKLTSEISTFKANYQAVEEKLSNQKREMEELQAKARLEFENIANKILEKNSKEFVTLNESNIKNILTPLNKDLESFKKKVEETQLEATKQNFSLGSQLKSLHEQSERVSNEANNLAKALKGDKKSQGNWGEMVLESILEYSGLEKDIQYFTQQTIVDEVSGGNIRPDVIVALPDNRKVVIDSKVSLVDYERFSSSDIQEDRQSHMKSHINAIRNHIKTLSDKDYGKNTPGSLDFTIMFVAIEPAYLAAVQYGGGTTDLWKEAYSKKVILASPTTLIACLRIIDELWTKEKQNRNAQDIVNVGKSLYEKLAGFVESFEGVGSQISKAKESYDKAYGQLKTGRGNAINQTEKLRKLGINPSENAKSIIAKTIGGDGEDDDIDDDVKQLTP